MTTLPSTHRVVMLSRFGGPEGFAVTEVPLPQPGPGEVLVKVLAASVQFTDVILRKGQYPDLKQKPPLVLGYDLVGEVVRCGPGVTTVSVGQRVADLTMVGSYGEYRTLRADRVVAVDPSLDPAEATSLVLSWLTAYQLLHRDAHVKAGQHLLVLGASGSVGQALLVLGRLAGCEVWGAAHEKHAALVRSLDAVFVDSDSADLATLRPDRFEVVFDGIGELGFSRSWHAVGRFGRLSAFGFSAGVQKNTPFAVIGWWFAKLWFWNTFFGRRSANFFSITAVRKQHPAWFAEDLGALFGLLRTHRVKPRVAERIGLEGVADAQRKLEHGGLEGKIVLEPQRPRPALG